MTHSNRPITASSKALLGASALALSLMVPLAPAAAQQANAPRTIDAAIQPGSEEVTSYRALQGYQLDTGNASRSGARRVYVSRKREGDRAVTVFERGGGVDMRGVNDDMVIIPRRRTGMDIDVFGYDYGSKTMAGGQPMVASFNQLLTPMLRDAANLPANASWQAQLPLSLMAGLDLGDGMVQFDFERQFVEHDGAEYALISYSVPAFAYTDINGRPMIHWARGFLITDAAYSTIYYWGAGNMGTADALSANAEPMSARLFTYAVDDDGQRLLDISNFAEAQAMIDEAVAGMTEYAFPVREESAQLYNGGFFSVAQAIDVTGSALGENSGNQGDQNADGVWQDTGTAGARSAQANNLVKTFFRAIDQAGSEESRAFLQTIREGINAPLTGANVSEQLLDNWDDMVRGLRDLGYTNVSAEGVTAYFRAGVAEEGAGFLKSFGLSSLDNVAKVAGPIAHLANAYTVYQAINEEPAALGQMVGNNGAGDIMIPGTDLVIFDGGQFFDRVVLDVGGLYLDVATGDLLSFGSDGITILVKSAADIGRGGAIAWDADKWDLLPEATKLEIAGQQYGRQKPVVDDNLPQLLEANVDTGGRDYSNVVARAENISDRSDWELLNTTMPFSFAIVEASGSISEEAANQLTEYNFKAALLNYLEQVNPDFEPEPGGGTEPPAGENTEVDPPVDDGGDPGTPDEPGDGEPDDGDPGGGDPEGEDPGPTGEVEGSTAPRNGDGETGEDPEPVVTPTPTPTPRPTPPPVGSTQTGETGRVLSEPREGWYNEYAYDENGTWIGYIAVYPLAKPTPPKPDPQDPQETADTAAEVAEIADDIFGEGGLPTGDSPTGDLILVGDDDTGAVGGAGAGADIGVGDDESWGDLTGDILLAGDGAELDEEALAAIVAQMEAEAAAAEEERQRIRLRLTPSDLGDPYPNQIEYDDEPEYPNLVDYGDGSYPEQQGRTFGDPASMRDATPEELAQLRELLADDEDAQKKLDGQNLANLDLSSYDVARLRYLLEDEDTEGLTDLVLDALNRGDFDTSPLADPYPNQLDYGRNQYPNMMQMCATTNTCPPGWISTPTDLDSFNKFTKQNAFKYGNMSGMIPTFLPEYEAFVLFHGLDKLNELARRAGYPNIWAALQDKDWLIHQSKDPRFIRAAFDFTCNVSWGVNYDCIAFNAQERSQLDLGRLLDEGRGLFSDSGLSDVTLSGRLLAVMLRDFGLEDGDIVSLNIEQFGRTLFNANINLTNAGQTVQVNLNPGVASLEAFAVNEGAVSPNTAEISISNISEGEELQTYSLSTGETATLKIKVAP